MKLDLIAVVPGLRAVYLYFGQLQLGAAADDVGGAARVEQRNAVRVAPSWTASLASLGEVSRIACIRSMGEPRPVDVGCRPVRSK